MASLNVADWSPDQVAEWMSGLEVSVARYAGYLRAQELAGARLLTLRCDDLEYLGVYAIGHQELLLEAVDHLRNFHYEMRRERWPTSRGSCPASSRSSAGWTAGRCAPPRRWLNVARRY
ncbi:SAM domain (Sterile alpha motif) domain-containing protein [Phthorimaea operculella]|nr:SAM domain (Sterile alpha motif) domain-containing protein [Phthorimaea operculella]